MPIIRQAHASDWDAISDFVICNYGPSAAFKQRARWRWQMSDAPYPMADHDRPPSWIALDGDAVVGQISLQPGRLWIAGEPLDIGWIVDVMVAPSHRGQGLGHALYAAILDSGAVAVTLTMAPGTRRIAERAGALELPPVSQMVRLNNLSAQTLNRMVEHSAHQGGKGRFLAPFMGGVAGRVAAKLISVAGRVYQPAMAHSGGTVQIIDQCQPADVERLFAVMRDECGALADRSSQFWQWRFEQAPDLPYRFARDMVDGVVRGVVAWREPLDDELPIGTIADVLADPQDQRTIARLIDFAAQQMGECEAIVAGASHPAFITAFRRAGFITVKQHRPLVSCHESTVHQRLAAIAGRPWHLSKADNDWDQIHPVK